MKKPTDTNDKERFDFGENWIKYIKYINEAGLEQAETSLKSMLDLNDLAGKRFLDIGSGSGLFSLAARRLGAHVHSFDYDTQSVACTSKLKLDYFPGDANWAVEQGDVLDFDYIQSLGGFDIVYSWGVLHHTGNMWQAINNAHIPVDKDGLLFIAIYNDQGRASHLWKKVKKAYNILPKYLRFLILCPAFARLWGPSLIRDTIRHGNPLYSWNHYDGKRGMSPWRDFIDWVGGYPFEVAKPEQIFSYFYDRGFTLNKLTTCGGGLGCNQFVFSKNKP
jgi:SAM-dependent methyltransferase